MDSVGRDSGTVADTRISGFSKDKEGPRLVGKIEVACTVADKEIATKGGNWFVLS